MVMVIWMDGVWGPYKDHHKPVMFFFFSFCARNPVTTFWGGLKNSPMYWER